ncbi:hypothetical protein [Bradyrhizobium sp. PRIMUS42]|uniref:hypothetical protein n=1 Tax=Bradyrhizobium sp. PRIMUS42 TaxID=2908926 RepID=UPI001FF58B0F|nr:hypothetical protein [Bradyrhizobium sp. PRIMUS42]MCJ9732820.1 hypothetical protein [Bradyrhizobium sp. PRIMUS42]
MLFCYPIDATSENWLHDCLLEMATTAIHQIELGNPPAGWPSCIPADHRPKLRSRTGIRDRFRAFCKAAGELSSAERLLILNALTSENDFPVVFSGVGDCLTKNDLPGSIHEFAKDLFEFAFELLTQFEIRDRQYRLIYDAAQAHVCPFCGIEAFDAPGMAREDLDHYLAMSLYPFAGVNLRNLTPMGRKCNAAHKRATDMLRHRDSGIRRRCIDPYAGPTASVSLLQSVPFEGKKDGAILLPDWRIDLNGPDEEISTWAEVFNIRRRYKENVLDAEFRGWMDNFAQWCQLEFGALQDAADVANALSRYLAAVIQEGFADRVFLKKAVFEMLRQRCVDPPVSDRLVAWFIALVSPTKGATASA